MIIMLVYLVWFYVPMRYCHLNTSMFIMYLNYISHQHQKFLCRRILADHQHHHSNHFYGRQVWYCCFIYVVYWHIYQQLQTVRIGNW